MLRGKENLWILAIRVDLRSRSASIKGSWLPSSDNSTTTPCAGLESSSVRYRKNGHDAMSVVDVKLKVYGVNGLRIADAKTEGKKRMTSLRKAELGERFPGF